MAEPWLVLLIQCQNMKTELLKQVSHGDSEIPFEVLQGFFQKSASMPGCSNIDVIIKSITQ